MTVNIVPVDLDLEVAEFTAQSAEDDEERRIAVALDRELAAARHLLVDIELIGRDRWVAVCGCRRRFVGEGPTWDSARDLHLAHKRRALAGER